MKRTHVAALAGFLVGGLSLGAPAAQGGAPNGTHKEIGSIGVSGKGKIGNLATLCVTADDRLLACDAAGSDIKVFDLAGKLLATWPLPFAPSAICTDPDGAVYVGGVAKLAKLDAGGKVLKTADVPQALSTSPAGMSRTGRFSRDGRRPVGKASGMVVMGGELFVSFGSGWSLRAKDIIVRFDRDLGGGTKIAEGLNGCCQRLDLTARAGENVLYVAENSRYRVLRMDREGKVLGNWGGRSRTDVAGFGSCCNPMNLCFGPGGVLYTSESGLGRVKRYAPTDGKFLSLVGEVGVTRFTRAGGLAASCSNIALAVSSNGSKVFVQDVKTNGIRVLAGPAEKRVAAAGK